MGPRSDERGNINIRRHTRNAALASMGPRSDERGNHPKSKHFTPMEAKASMGPRSDERGNTFPCLRYPIVCRLQWGRARMSAEISQKTALFNAASAGFNGAALG